jgi:SRSO17 transposase
MALRRAGKGDVLGVASDQMFNAWGRTPPISGTAAAIAATLTASAWQRLSAGAGTTGPRRHDWAYLALADLEANEYGEDRSGLWTRGLLIRRDLGDGKMAFFTTWCPTGTAIETLVWVAGHRWAVEDGFETAKNELGLDHNETRSWNGWHRHVSLVMLAFAMLAAIRHRLNAETMTAEQLETVPSARPRPVRGRHRWDRGLDPPVGAGDPPSGRAAEPAAHPARSHHRLVALAKGPSSRRTRLAFKKKMQL